MSILQLDVEGFRSLREISWRPGRLNVLIGPNGSGKSNLLRVLEFLAIAAQGGLARHVQREGGMIPLVWDGRAERIRFRVAMPSVASESDATSGPVTYELTLVRLGSTGLFRVESEFLGDLEQAQRGSKREAPLLLHRTGRGAYLLDERRRRLAPPPEDLPAEETLISVVRGPFLAHRSIWRYQREIASWSVHHGLHTDREAAIRAPSVARSETRVDPDGQNLIAVLHTLYTNNREFKREVSMGMRSAFSDDFEELLFPPAADQRIQLRVRWRSLRSAQSAADLSDGTLRFLFLLAVLANPEPPPLIAIDEPETGLHPSMFPIVAEYAAEASQRTQVILTTHSPDVLDAFRGITPVTTVVECRGGETQLKVLSSERLQYWLRRYTLGELYRSRELEAME